MYVRENPAAPIEWEPNDMAAAERAMREVVDSDFEWNDERNRRTLDDDTAKAVRERYAELVSE